MGEGKIKRKDFLNKLLSLLLTLILLPAVSSFVTAHPHPAPPPSRGRVVDKLEGNVEHVLSLSDLGYSKDIYLSGASTEFNMYLPNYRGLSKTSAEFLLRFAGVLDNRSTYTVLVDDIPLFTKNLGMSGYEPVVSFDIGHSKADHIKITIRGHLFITGDICYDLPTGNLWMVISNKSNISIAAKQVESHIADFFKTYDKDINIVLGKDAESLNILPLIYNINKLNDWKEINISVNDAPVMGMKNIITGNFSKDIEIKEGDLFVSKNGLSLFRKDMAGSYITPVINNLHVNDVEGNQKKEISLMDMGIKGFTATGLGDMSFNIPVRFSTFTGIPRNLYMKLILNHTPVPENERAYLKVFLNGILIHANKLEGGGNINSYNIKIPEDQLKGYNNNLNIVTSYFISKGECKGSMPNLTISILDSTYFYFDGAERQGITPVVDVMGSMSGKVLIMADNNDMFKPAVYLMDLLGKFNREITDIDVLPWKGEIPDNYNFVILALNPSGIKSLDVPLKVEQGRFSIINPLSKKEIFSSEYGNGFGVFQTFDKGKAKVLLLSYYKDKGALEFIKGFDKDTLSRMLGNVVIFNEDIASFDIGEKFRVVYKEIKSTGYYWDKYKLFIILILGASAIVFLYFIKKKIVRSEKED